MNWAFSRKSSEFKVTPFLNQFDYNYIKVRQMVLFTAVIFFFWLLNLLYLLSKAAMDCKKNLKCSMWSPEEDASFRLLNIRHTKYYSVITDKALIFKDSFFFHFNLCKMNILSQCIGKHLAHVLRINAISFRLPGSLSFHTHLLRCEKSLNETSDWCPRLYFEFIEHPSDSFLPAGLPGNPFQQRFLRNRSPA